MVSLVPGLEIITASYSATQSFSNRKLLLALALASLDAVLHVRTLVFVEEEGICQLNGPPGSGGLSDFCVSRHLKSVSSPTILSIDNLLVFMKYLPVFPKWK